LSDDSIHVVFSDQAGNLWVGTENGGLNLFQKETEDFVHFRVDCSDTNCITDNYIRDICEDQEGNLWIATPKGLNLFDRRKARFDHFFQSTLDPNSLSTNNVSRLFLDRGTGLWVSTFSGLNYCYPQYQKFYHLRYNPFNPNSLDNDNVRSIFEDKTGIIWVGTEGGLNKIEPNSGQITHFRHDPADSDSLSPLLYVTAITAGPDGVLWLGLWGGELNCFDTQSGKFWRPSTFLGCPAIKNIQGLYCDHDGNIWVGDYNQGLFCFPGGKSQQAPRHYYHDPADPHSLSANTVKVIYADNSNQLWVGTHTGGLNRFDPELDGFHIYTADSAAEYGLSNDWVETICQDRAGVLWIGTYDGLNRYDRESDSFVHYGQQDGLPNATIIGILEETSPLDHPKNLWLSTNQGIVKFDPQTETVHSFGAAEGVQTWSEVSGYLVTQAGEMFFGGYGGLTGFSPADIALNPTIPPVIITDFLLFNQSVPIEPDSPLERAIWATKTIRLSAEDYNFALEFATLSYVDPSKNCYKYKLEGFDRDWITADSQRRYAAYTNLPAGEYVFRVQGSNNHGIWNETGATLKISVAQPLWERLRLQKEAAEAANQAKSAFLAKISHELRTPLNSILGYAQYLFHETTVDSEQTRFIQSILRSGQHLLTLVNEILELSKIEAGHLKFEPADFNLTQMLRELEGMFQLTAKEKGVDLVFEANYLPQFVSTDEIKLRQVLINLLDNAVKFTDLGHIRMSIYLDPNPIENFDEDSSFSPNALLQFAVHDTGLGIAADEMDSVFEPFVQTLSGRESRRGTGLGMAISHQYVQFMGGELTVRSEPGIGSIFGFNLPVQIEAIWDDFQIPMELDNIPEIESDPLFVRIRRQISTLPATWSEELYQAFIDLDIPRIHQLIGSIETQEPELAAVFTRWVKEFKYSQLMALIHPKK